MKVLLVEDQKYMAYAVEHIFKKNKINIDIVFDGLEGLEYGLTNSYDVIVLDVMLPSMDGFNILRRLREEKINTPVIMLTAKIELEDKLTGFDMGADDYLTKPFESEELLARVKTLSRRSSEIVTNVLKYSNLELNLDNLILSCEDKSYSLTLKETQLLEMFLKKPETIVAKEVMINKLWNIEQIVVDNNVEVYISFLRKKLESLATGVVIKTVRGIGYKIIEEKND